jgi:hypothetical protein
MMDDDETGEKEGGARLRRGGADKRSWRVVCVGLEITVHSVSQGESLHGGESKTHVDVAVAEFLAGDNSLQLASPLFRRGT